MAVGGRVSVNIETRKKETATKKMTEYSLTVGRFALSCPLCGTDYWCWSSCKSKGGPDTRGCIGDQSGKVDFSVKMMGQVHGQNVSLVAN